MNNKLRHIKETILTGWSFVRFLRLFLSIAMFAEAFRTTDWFMGILGAILLWQVYANAGCCAVYNGSQKGEKDQEVIYEEVK